MKKIIIFLSICIISTQSYAQLELLNDEFDDVSTFSNWLQVNDTEGWNSSQLERAFIDGADGSLLIEPYTVAWYANRRAPLIYKLVTGDFIFTTEVRITDRDLLDSDHTPSSGYSLAGPMIRVPKPFTNGLTGWATGPNENYVFLSAGFASTSHSSCPGCPSPHFEVKNTTNGNSILNISSLYDGISSPPSVNDLIVVTIRLVRIGSIVFVLYKIPGNDFVVHRRYFRSNFPSEMQIGFVTYSDWTKVFSYSLANHNQYTLNSSLDPNLSNNPAMPFNPDLTARFQYARFNEVVIPPELTGVNLFSVATDEQLLSFLSFESTAVLPIVLKSFKATAFEKEIVLDWTTLSESNNEGFGIQRSIDKQHFFNIGFVNRKYDINQETNYTFVDNNVKNGVNYYYRLKQIDIDGQFSISPIRQANVSSFVGETMVYPNPVKDKTTISIQNTLNEEAQLKIVNLRGELINQQRLLLNKGRNETTINTSQWSKGVYTLVIEKGSGHKIIRLIKL